MKRIFKEHQRLFIVSSRNIKKKTWTRTEAGVKAKRLKKNSKKMNRRKMKNKKNQRRMQ